MKKKDIILSICSVFSILIIFGNENLGFVPINGAQSFGFNFSTTLIHVGAFWFIWEIIKNFKAKKKNSSEQNMEKNNMETENIKVNPPKNRIIKRLITIVVPFLLIFIVGVSYATYKENQQLTNQIKGALNGEIGN